MGVVDVRGKLFRIILSPRSAELRREHKVRMTVGLALGLDDQLLVRVRVRVSQV